MSATLDQQLAPASSTTTIDQNPVNAGTADQNWVVAALYQFHPVADPSALQQQLLDLLSSLNICGTLIVAGEGINGTVAGSRAAIDQMRHYLLDYGFTNMEYKESSSSEKPFRKTKVKLKKEIVTLGVEVQPRSQVGHYLNPEEWHDFIQQDDVILIDTRNDYEYKAGTFKNAIDPQTESFREFPEYVEKNLSDAKDKKIAMFCTGGIRCEKSTSLLLQQGFKEVYHLKGGILNYLEKIPADESLWEGECFVFDNRTGVTHGVQEGESVKCHACGWPLTPEEVELSSYELGVSCVYCIDKTTEQQKAGFRMRQSQLTRAKRKRL
ncbi:rhodanese-like domain-containing protein [Alkanindiges hydrocarboniclasticus]|uniref:tRNA uridine(34) hydroxylase n=1 Tax=Alkanindiges hydrocarboniclasticus TaxID=1907941 RepID=A0A1S8CYZ7_9GAMM|nr:rhodanese-related sulfurtransferase [Alkanindiges hydrocarboniclasticus]ONG41877.1 rhodanese-like domain-containing protein [Alkanindiges hydrocarboniclasticus]